MVFIGFYVLFLAVGAFVFSAIEAPEEAARVRELKELRQDFLDGHKCVEGTYLTIPNDKYLMISTPYRRPSLVASSFHGDFRRKGTKKKLFELKSVE